MKKNKIKKMKKNNLNTRHNGNTFPHISYSSPSPKLNNKKGALHNLKAKFTPINLFCTFICLTLVFICRHFLHDWLHFNLNTFKVYILLGIGVAGVKALLDDLLDLIIGKLYTVDENIEKSLVSPEAKTDLNKEKIIEEYIENMHKPIYTPFTKEYTPLHCIDNIKKDRDYLLKAKSIREAALNYVQNVSKGLESSTADEKAYQETKKIFIDGRISRKESISDFNNDNFMAETIKGNIEGIDEGVDTKNKFINGLKGVNTSSIPEFAKRYNQIRKEIESTMSEEYKLNQDNESREYLRKFDEKQLREKLADLYKDLKNNKS